MKKTPGLICLLTLFSACASIFAQDDGFRPLFNGKDVSGWKLRHPESHNSWSVLPGGILKNTVEKGAHGTDLMTEQKFWNFTVRYEYMTPDNSNSGFYLRGRQEIQILGDYASGKASPTCNGSIYNFKAPDKFVTKPGGEWQTAEVTIVGHRITVILNGVKIHDNVECDRPTGGQIDDNMDVPGPILLQGDHGTVSFRNIRIKELPKN
jgi:3-keto-disaccharide hydrolase